MNEYLLDSASDIEILASLLSECQHQINDLYVCFLCLILIFSSAVILYLFLR